MEDLPEVLRVYGVARAFMQNNGNPDQWGEHYPPTSLVENDIRTGELFVVLDGEKIVAAFVFFVRPEPDYAVLKSGSWAQDGDYGVMHRVASDGSVKGVFSAIFAFARKYVNHLRIDTHEDNLVMQAVLARHGFVRRGVAIVRGGGERFAYEYNG
jgi:hypothetical protein